MSHHLRMGRRVGGGPSLANQLTPVSSSRRGGNAASRANLAGRESVPKTYDNSQFHCVTGDLRQSVLLSGGHQALVQNRLALG